MQFDQGPSQGSEQRRSRDLAVSTAGHEHNKHVPQSPFTEEKNKLHFALRSQMYACCFEHSSSLQSSVGLCASMS